MMLLFTMCISIHGKMLRVSQYTPRQETANEECGNELNGIYMIDCKEHR
jgi:hypothetical protein